MGRVFGRGELLGAVLEVTAEVGPANGYTIMKALGDAVGDGWRPSPGAVYPALLTLEGRGWVACSGGSGGRVYEVTAAGRARLDDHPTVLVRAARRARSAHRGVTLGSVLDRAVARMPGRRRVLDAERRARVEDLIREALGRVDDITKGRGRDG